MLKIGKALIRAILVITIGSILCATLIFLANRLNVAYRIDNDWQQFQFHNSWLRAFAYSLFFLGGSFFLYRLVVGTVFNYKTWSRWQLALCGILSAFLFTFVIYSLGYKWEMNKFRSGTYLFSLVIVGAMFPLLTRLAKRTIIRG